jgi:lactate racemase
VIDGLNDLADIDALFSRLAESPLLAGREVARLAPIDPPPIDLAAALATALAAPVGAPPLRELARGKRTAVIITSDATRATPSATLIGPVVDELSRGGIAADDVEVVIGLGAHRPATPDEIRHLLGAQWAARLRVSNHDARAGDLVALGQTARGVPLLLNRRVAGADLKIAFGQVEPHEFAGFTGGRKAILPSVAGYETIVRNHALDMLTTPTARPGILDGNPVHEEMLAAARLAGLDFIVNVALDGDSRPIAVAAGDPDAAHRHLVAFLRRHLGVATAARPPALIVTGTGAPLDINLYQTVKALIGIEPLLDMPRGAAPAPVVVLLSRCWDGGGSEEMFEPFLQARELLRGRAVTPAGPQTPAGPERPTPAALSEAVVACLERDFTIEKDESYFIARVTPKCRAVVACCPGVSDERLRLAGSSSATTPEFVPAGPRAAPPAPSYWPLAHSAHCLPDTARRKPYPRKKLTRRSMPSL